VKKAPCWDCIAVALLSLPAGLAYLMYQSYKTNTDFKVSLLRAGALSDKLSRLKAEWEKKGYKL
jgi:hypothetical protein